MNSTQSGKNKQSVITTRVLQRSVPGGTKQHQGLNKLLSRNKQGPQVTSDSSLLSIFPRDIFVRFEAESLPWALYVKRVGQISKRGGGKGVSFLKSRGFA